MGKLSSKLWNYYAIARISFIDLLKSPFELFVIIVMPIILISIFTALFTTNTLLAVLHIKKDDMLAQVIPMSITFSIANTTLKVFPNKIIGWKRSSLYRGLNTVGISKTELYLVLGILYYLIMLFISFASILYAWLLYRTSYNKWFQMNTGLFFLGIFLTLFLNISISIMIISLFVTIQAADAVTSIILIPTAILSGQLLPDLLLNSTIKNYVSWFIPQRYPAFLTLHAFNNTMGSVSYWVYLGIWAWILVPIIILVFAKLLILRSRRRSKNQNIKNKV